MINIITLKTIHENSANYHVRFAEISITKNNQTYLLQVGGLPLDGDVQSLLDLRFDELWKLAEEKGEVPKTETIFSLPVSAPDFIVSTPPIHPDPEKALDEAIAEMEKGESGHKSIALIALSMAKYLKSKKNKLK